MNIISSLTVNPIINVGFVSWAVAQILKTLFAMFKYKKFFPERLVGSGGMPSSHTSLVVATTLTIAKLDGVSSSTFGLSTVFMCVVIYDAMGVRRAAGEQAKVLNRITFDFRNLANFFDRLNKEIAEEFAESTEELGEQKELKEFLGHTPLEVLGGALVGIIVSSVM